MRTIIIGSAALAAALFAISTPAYAAKCNPPGGFPAFIAEFKKDATARAKAARETAKAVKE